MQALWSKIGDMYEGLPHGRYFLLILVPHFHSLYNMDQYCLIEREIVHCIFFSLSSLSKPLACYLFSYFFSRSQLIKREIWQDYEKKAREMK